MQGPRLRGLPVFGTAMAGLVVGHTISYLIAVPDPHHRQLVLQETGHGYMPELTQLALMVAAAAVAALVARAFARREDSTESYVDLARTLAVAQVFAYVGQEVLERVVAHAPLHTLGHDRVLLTGVVVQLVLAVVAARILRWIAGATARLASAHGTRAALPRPGGVLLATAEASPHSPRPLSARRVRAPPAG